METSFPELRGDEDAVTGALAHAIRSQVKGVLIGYIWLTRMWMLRGRGHGAPQSEYGLDALIEMRVLDAGANVIGQKGMGIQAKKEWTRRNRDVVRQAALIERIPGSGIVVNYREARFVAVTARDVLTAKGDWRKVPLDQVRPLADYLGGGFLDCDVGSRALHYDASQEQLMTVDEAGRQVGFHIPVRRRVRTLIQRAE